MFCIFVLCSVNDICGCFMGLVIYLCLFFYEYINLGWGGVRVNVEWFYISNFFLILVKIGRVWFLYMVFGVSMLIMNE